MTLNDDIRTLSAAAIFSQLNEEQLRLLAFGAERMPFSAGQTLYREGDRADCGYVIASGTVALSRIVDGQPVTLQTCGPASVLGQLALITGTERATSAVAQTNAAVLRINRSLFRRMLSEYPETAKAIHDQLADDLKRFVEQIERIERRLGEAPEL